VQTAHIKVLLCFSLTHLFLCRVVLSYTTALFKLGMSHPPWAPTRLSGFSDVNMLCRQKISSFVCLGTGGVSDFFQSTFQSHTFVCYPLRFSEWDGGQVHGRKQRERSSAHCIFRSTVNFDLPDTLRIQCPLPLTFGPCYPHVKHPAELFCSYICPCLYPSVCLRDFEKEKYTVQTPSNSEICYLFIFYKKQ